MPKIENSVIEARTVKKGDRVSGRVVETRKTGSKWTELREVDGTLILRTLNEDPISVAREVPTDEERAAQRAEAEAKLREANNVSIEKWVRGAVDGYAEAMHKITQNLVERFSRYSSYSSYDDLLETDAMHKIACSIEHVWKASRSEDRNREYWDEIGEVDWVKAYELWAEDVKEKLLDRWSSRVFSRSTSVISNLLEDVERAATLQVLNAMRYGYFRL